MPLLNKIGLSDEDVVIDAFRMAEGAPCPMVRVLYKVDTDAVPPDEEALEVVLTVAQ